MATFIVGSGRVSIFDNIATRYNYKSATEFPFSRTYKWIFLIQHFEPLENYSKGQKHTYLISVFKTV